ncbi:LacI family transcriptional regulator [Halanaerobium saccharolyticum]|uniref:LacI family transcriptional regulator n=1 Tax=Halanaerobium saccharolyticum TaxID=43595 RepID=A0A4R6LZI1_9FIRM|nr:LacI family DNA-binding transcriptional regulator [Halanaerobium saccharolyticum]TDO94327.1 LacI family transcriptional regulator [Halanaerobium saccharolyticum]
MTTMKDIAEKAGVSRSTVSRVINGHDSVKEEKRQRILKIVKELNFKPNKVAQSLVSNQSYLIGVIAPNISNPFYSEIIEALEIEANNKGYNIIVCNSAGDIKKEENYIDILFGRQVDGIVIIPSKFKLSHYEELKDNDIPVVTLTKDINKFDSVLISHQKGGALAAKHFMEMGHQQFAFIGPHPDLEGKLKGYEKELEKKNISIDKKNYIECNFSGRSASQKVYNAVSKYLNDYGLKATAYFVGNDLGAFGAIHAFYDAGYKIPDDLSIVGFDNTFFASESRPTLSSIAQPIDKMVKVTIDILLRRLKDKDNLNFEHKFLEPELIVRESSDYKIK